LKKNQSHDQFFMVIQLHLASRCGLGSNLTHFGN